MNGFRLKYFRKMRKLTQERLAAISSVDLSNIQRLEAGKNQNPSFETMKLLSVALLISPQEIFFPEFHSFLCRPQGPLPLASRPENTSPSALTSIEV